MMRYASAAAAAVGVLLAGAPAAAQTVVTSDQLPVVNGAAGGGTVSTTSDATGVRTTVTGPGGAPNRYVNATPPSETWVQQNVGGDATVGVTTDFARNGNGSAYFAGMDGDSKADLEYYFKTPFALSDLTALSYDAYRDGSSTAPAHLVNSLRLMIGDANGVYTNTYLIFEPTYNGFPVAAPIAADTWHTFSIDGSSTLWANSGNLSEPLGAGACPACYGAFSAWKAANPNATVVGLSTGLGSGWNGSYRGAVDNISFTVAGETTSFNFEVAVVPEPATWALLILGFGAVGGLMRRSRPAGAPAAA